MSGQRPIVAQEAPDIESQILSYYFEPTLLQRIPLFIAAEKDIIVESCVVRVDVTDASNVSLQGRLCRVASGTVMSTNTPMTDYALIGDANAAALGKVNQVVKLLPDTASTRNYGVPTQNIVPGPTVTNGVAVAGQTCILEFDSAPHSSLKSIVVTLRISTKKH